jgi:hypothetical protein
VKRRAFVIMPACLSLILSFFLMSPNVPSELSGTWSTTNSSGYVEEFTFSSSTIQYRGYLELYPESYRTLYKS